MVSDSNPVSSARASRGRIWLVLGIVYIVWGSTYLAMRYAIATIPPFWMSGTRHFVAGTLLFGFLKLRGIRWPSLREWGAAARVGILLLSLGNGGVVWSEQYVASGVTALIVAFVAIWMVLIDWLQPGGHRPRRGVFIGLSLGLAGVALLVGPAHVGGDQRVNVTGACVLVLASFAWALGSIISRRLPLPREPLLATAMEMLCGGAVLWLLGGLAGEGRNFHLRAVTPHSLLALGYLVVMGSLVGFTAYIWLLGAARPTQVATYAYVNPLVAVVIGWSMGGEPLGLRTVLAAAVILSGVASIVSSSGARPALAVPKAMEMTANVSCLR